MGLRLVLAPLGRRVPAGAAGGQGYLAARAIESADRRREKRYQVDLPGTVQVDGAAHAVIVSDLSASGALVSLTGSMRSVASPEILLLVDDFGPIAARIVHLGTGFSGVRFTNPNQHREKLNRWLQQEVSS